MIYLLANACKVASLKLYYGILKEANYMANTKAVYARIDTKLKENAESILQQLGISPSSAIQMLYSQIVRTNGFPLDLHLSYQTPTAIGNMSQTELNTALEEGYESALTGKKYSVEEVNQLMKEEFQMGTLEK